MHFEVNLFNISEYRRFQIIRIKFKVAREQIQKTIKMFKINCLMIAMLVTMTSSATSFLRALDQNINRVPTIYEMVSSDLLDFTLYGSDNDLD